MRHLLGKLSLGEKAAGKGAKQPAETKTSADESAQGVDPQ